MFFYTKHRRIFFYLLYKEGRRHTCPKKALLQTLFTLKALFKVKYKNKSWLEVSFSGITGVNPKQIDLTYCHKTTQLSANAVA